MKIALINPAYDKKLNSLENLVKLYFHPRELTRALLSKSINTTWVQGFCSEDEYDISPLQMCTFISSPFYGGIENLMSQHIDRDSLSRVIEKLQPDVVHIFGFLPTDILAINDICSSASAILTASFHGSNPAKNNEFLALQKQALSKLSLILFNSPERIKTWKDAGLIDSSTLISICPETSSFFELKSRKEARIKTGLVGNPVCITTCRLHPVKDPLTLLNGFEKILAKKPGARLYWVYQTDEMLEEITDKLNESSVLNDAVSLSGPLDFADMEDFYNSADFFLQASVTEYGGNSLCEAMACGVIPVVTNIPSFQYLTGNNQFRTLFDIGNSNELAQNVLSIPPEKYSDYSQNIRTYFDKNLSFNLIATTLLNTIDTVVTMRSG